VVVEQIEQTGFGASIWARVRAQDGTWPSCGYRSRRVHSRDDRRLADGSVGGRPVVLRLRVRRFFCDYKDCPMGTFAEQVDGLTTKHARRTSLCREALEHIGLAVAGRAESRLASRLGFQVGRGTVLRLVHALPSTNCSPSDRW
jgi:transposase